MIMIRLKHCFDVLLATLSFILAFYSVGCLMLFLSSPAKPAQGQTKEISDNDSLKNVVYSLLVDWSLLALFTAQHSIMARPPVKRLLHSIGLNVAERSIYNIATAIALYIVVWQWRSVNYFSLWHWDVETRPRLYWALVLLHTIAWGLIYGGCLLMDIPELLGIKQVYYSIKGLSPPIAYKSMELRRLYSHMRHPSPIALAIVFWVVPTLSLDRLLLAVIWTGYMMLAWRTDALDVEYQQGQFMRKRYELTRMLN